MFFLPVFAIACGIGASTVGGIGIAAGGSAFGLSAGTVTALGVASGALIGNTIDKAVSE